jgi:3-hydroxyacyl-[acyl-carrier-protein] dehydratase
MSVSKEILDTIPHREPFLFIDSIQKRDDKGILCFRKVPENEFFFKGHYPGNPIMPGVILCETMFQAGALFLAGSKALKHAKGVPVVTRVRDVKFMKIIRPGDELEIEAILEEILSNVFFMKGSIRCKGKVSARARFACTLIEEV